MAKLPFKDVGAHARWIIKDERGNGVTDEPLIPFESVAVIQVFTDEQKGDTSHRVEEESSMGTTVRFYDQSCPRSPPIMFLFLFRHSDEDRIEAGCMPERRVPVIGQ